MSRWQRIWGWIGLAGCVSLALWYLPGWLGWVFAFTGLVIGGWLQVIPREKG